MNCFVLLIIHSQTIFGSETTNTHINGSSLDHEIRKGLNYDRVCLSNHTQLGAFSYS